MRALTFCLLVVSSVSAATATDRFYWNITAHSPSGQFRVDATSTDNDGKTRTAFQSNFIYRCVDTSSGKGSWVRKQAMGEPLRFGEGEDSFEISHPLEASPVAIYVSDSGWTVIRNAWDELIVVGRDGKDVGKIDVLENGFTEAEKDSYVRYSMAGPYWSRLSAWYFLPMTTDEYFVIRPWWGRRIFIDLKNCQLVSADLAKLRDAAKAQEAKLILSALKSKDDLRGSGLSKQNAAYLAGALKIKEAIPLLRSLEMSEYSGSCTFGAFSFGEDFYDEVDPYSYCTMTHRQIAQLSLRRLGESPAPLPCHTFKWRDGDTSCPFIPLPRNRPRHELARCIKSGMDAAQVLTLIGSPDFVAHDTWSYDMDAPEPYSVILTFEARRVKRIESAEPLWKSGLSRDGSLAY